MFRISLIAGLLSMLLLIPAAQAAERESAEEKAGKTPAPAELMEMAGDAQVELSEINELLKLPAVQRKLTKRDKDLLLKLLEGKEGKVLSKTGKPRKDARLARKRVPAFRDIKVAEPLTLNEVGEWAGATKNLLEDSIKKVEEQLKNVDELGEMDRLKLQELMERHNRLLQMLSNIMKAHHDTVKNVIRNIK